MFKLFNHQRKALNYLRFNDGFLLTLEQGTGKTLVGLCRVLELIKDKKINSALIVCPKSVIGSWERDIEKFSPSDQKIFQLVDIINYDSVWRKEKYKRQYDLILCDEAHNIVNRSSKRSKFLLKAAISAKYKYLLTGTPISNGRLEDSWSLICFLDAYSVRGNVYSNIWRELTGKMGSYYDWIERYAYLDQYYKPYKYKNISEVQDVLFKYSYSVKKIDCLDLPAKLPDELRFLKLEEKKLYKDMHKNNVVDGKDLLADNPMVKLLYLRQICSGNLDGEELKTAKDEALQDLLMELGAKKLVIFAEYTASINRIKGILDKLSISYTTQDGHSDRSNWKRFQEDASIRCIICQYQSGCQGIDLFSADTTLYYEPTLRSNVLEQSRDRTHRNGQLNKCSYIHFITKGTVEESIYKSLQGYQDFTTKLFSEYMESYTRRFRKGGVT